MLTAEEYLDGSPFVMYLGDNLLRDGITELVDRFRAGTCDAMILLQRVADPQAYGVAELEDGRVVRLAEKPAARPATSPWWGSTCSPRRSWTRPGRSGPRAAASSRSPTPSST